jgi:hypothetical protein
VAVPQKVFFLSPFSLHFQPSRDFILPVGFRR